MFNLQHAAKSLCLIPFFLTNTLLNSHLTTVFPLCLSPVPLGPGEEMGAKASLVEGPGPGSAMFPSPTLENIQAAYEEKQEEVARELIQQACCVECSAGMPRIDGVSTPKIYIVSCTTGWTVLTLTYGCNITVGYSNMPLNLSLGQSFYFDYIQYMVSHCGMNPI